MKCQYCNIALAPLRSLVDGEFCCDEHRVAFAERGPAPLPIESSLIPLKLESASAIIPEAQPTQSAPLEFQPKTMAAPSLSTLEEAHGAKNWLGLPGRLLSLKFRSQVFNSADPRIAKPAPGAANFPAAPVLPGALVEPPMVEAFRAASEAIPEEASESAGWEAARTEKLHSHHFGHLAAEAARSWHWMLDVWRKAPSELRIMTVLLPVLLAFAVSPSMPKVQISSNTGNQVQKLVADRWSTLNKNIVDRAAVA